MQQLLNQTKAFRREVSKRGRTRRAADMCPSICLLLDQFVETFDVRALRTADEKESALQTLYLCYQLGFDETRSKTGIYQPLRFAILQAWFEEVTIRYETLAANRLVAQELRENLDDWHNYLTYYQLSRKSEEARTIRTLQVQLANFQEDIFKEELAVDAFSACYTTAGLVYPPS